MITNTRPLRIAADLTQEQLAVKAGVTTKTIENAEAGRGVRLSTAVKIARALGVELADILDGARI